MPTFSIEDYHDAVGNLAIASQLLSVGKTNAKNWECIFNMTKVVIINMPDALLEKMFAVQKSITWPENGAIPIGPKDYIDEENRRLAVDGKVFDLLSGYAITKLAGIPVVWPEVMPEGLSQEITLIEAIESLLLSECYNDGFFCDGKLLCITWYIADVIGRSYHVKLPAADAVIDDYLHVAPPNIDEISNFLSRLRQFKSICDDLPKTVLLQIQLI